MAWGVDFSAEGAGCDGDDAEDDGGAEEDAGAGAGVEGGDDGADGGGAGCSKTAAAASRTCHNSGSAGSSGAAVMKLASGWAKTAAIAENEDFTRRVSDAMRQVERDLSGGGFL